MAQAQDNHGGDGGDQQGHKGLAQEVEEGLQARQGRNHTREGFEDNEDGLLVISKGTGTIERRQDAPKVWQLNGSIYVINPKSLMEKGLAHFDRIRKYPMTDYYSIDIDNTFDWKVAEMVLENKLVNL